MLRKLKELTGYKIVATDDEIGTVDDFYFDENTWEVRYMVVDTGPWLFGRKVLLSVNVLGHPFWEQKRFSVSITKDQVESSPSIDLAKPVSRREEAELSTHYGWSPYWLAAVGAATTGVGTAGTGYAAAAPAAVPIVAAHENELPPTDRDPQSEDVTTEATTKPHTLRSINEVTGYHISAVDGDIGHVEDFFGDDSGWKIQYLLIDTRNWLPGRQVLVAPNWISRISWNESKVHVKLSQEQIKESPEYNPAAPLDRAYETRLHGYYGMPGYWI